VVEDPFEITPDTFCIPTDYPEVADAPLWIHLLRDESGTAALIDCGVPSTYENVLTKALPLVGVEPEAIAWVILTHGHPDHMGGHSGLRGHSSFKVAAPLEDVIWVESVGRQWHDFWDCFPGIFSLEAQRQAIVDMCGGDLRVDRILRDGEVFRLGRRTLEVVRTRGHTRGHCALFEHETGILFCGDDVQGFGTGASSGTSVFAPLYDDVDDYLEGLHRLRALPFGLLCPAHRAPVERKAGLELIEQSIEFVHRVDGIVREELRSAEAPVSAVQVAGAVGRLCGTDPPVSIQTVYTALAHLNRVAREGLVTPQWAPVHEAG
jgi:glyoxylase-like metal-dependent hydrolase (beta-lactamase superfamily II)